MPRTCTICVHPERGALEHAMRAGTSLRFLAELDDVSPDALSRHRVRHMALRLPQEGQIPTDTLAEFKQVVTFTRAILQDGLGAADLRSALAVIRRAEAGMGLLGILVDRP